MDDSEIIPVLKQFASFLAQSSETAITRLIIPNEGAVDSDLTRPTEKLNPPVGSPQANEELGRIGNCPHHSQERIPVASSCGRLGAAAKVSVLDTGFPPTGRLAYCSHRFPNFPSSLGDLRS